MKTILLMLSGGLDSLGALYKLAKESDYHIHVHHIHMKTIERRHIPEAIAVNNIRKYFNDQNLEYSESTFEFPTFNGHFTWDTEVCNFIGANICSMIPEIEYIATGRVKDDSGDYSVMDEKTTKMIALYSEVKKLYPVINLTKQEIYNFLPDELKNIYWSCRRPLNNLKPCGKCPACKKDANVTKIL